MLKRTKNNLEWDSLNIYKNNSVNFFKNTHQTIICSLFYVKNIIVFIRKKIKLNHRTPHLLCYSNPRRSTNTSPITRRTDGCRKLYGQTNPSCFQPFWRGVNARRVLLRDCRVGPTEKRKERSALTLPKLPPPICIYYQSDKARLGGQKGHNCGAHRVKT